MTWIDAFPELKHLPADIQETLLQSGRVLSLPAGTVLFGPGQAPTAYLLVLGGSVRVQQVADNGREIVLYRVAPGESCAVTTSCLIGQDDYQAEALTESPVEAVAIPRPAFDSLIARSPEFRRFVFSALSARLTNLFKLIEDVAFSRIDIRLAHKLLELAGPDGHVAMTHQQLASELGTAREVISRQLHEFQRRGWLTTARGGLTIAASNDLQNLATLR